MPSRDELIQRGVSVREADAIEVHRNQREVLQHFLRRWMLLFVCTLCILGPTMLGLLVWLIIAWNQARYENLSCDAPLPEWVTVVYAFKAYNLLFHRLVVRLICRYDSREEPPRPPPTRVKLYSIFFPLFDFGWNIAGICMAAVSKTCEQNMPDLYRAVLAFGACGVFFTTFLVANSIGFQTILSYMLRHGMLRDENAGAPAGTLENQKVVPFDVDVFGEDSSCSICLEDFSSSKEIRRTSCGHRFHSQCLKGWLQVNSGCPLCRADLAAGLKSTNDTVGRPAGAAVAEVDPPV
jgi:hypothetical protein